MLKPENKSFLSRVIFVGIVQALLIVVLLGRMFYLQIFEGEYYKLLAEGNRVATRSLLPLRGQIYDRQGNTLVENETSFRLVLLTDKKDVLEDTFESLSKLIELTPEVKEETLRLSYKGRGLDSLIIKDNLTWDEVSTIELHANALPGVYVEVGSVRKYPKGLLGAHVMGYVSSPSEEEQSQDAELAIPGLKIGKVGLEKYLDFRLRGKPGHSAFEVNAKRKVVRELHQVPSMSGEDIHLTIDGELQDYIQDVLSIHESASAVVLDIQNGDILAMVSSPSFDPNLFPQGIRHADWNELQENPYVPLTNKAIAGLYSPGSTVKPLVALAALASGKIDKHTTVFCPGYFTVGNHRFHCWRKEGHGTVNVSSAISKSCDVFFYTMAKQLGIDSLAELYQNMGMGEGCLEGFPHVKKGLVPSKEWKLKKNKGKWTLSDSILTSIGQGYVLATPLELVVAIARLASGGKRVVPRFEGQGPVSFPDMGYQQESLDLVLQAMNDTVNLEGGTAFQWRIPEEGMEMGGKTGTSQVRRITIQQRMAGQTKTTHLPWKYREHGLFIGFAPIHAPRYAIAVVIEHSGGSSVAAHAARDILWKAQLLEKERAHGN